MKHTYIHTITVHTYIHTHGRPHVLQVSGAAIERHRQRTQPGIRFRQRRFPGLRSIPSRQPDPDRILLADPQLQQPCHRMQRRGANLFTEKQLVAVRRNHRGGVSRAAAEWHDSDPVVECHQ